MVYSGAYALVLALHLLTVVFLVGPAALAATGSPRLVRAGRADALRDASRTTRLYTLATLVVVVLGSALVGMSGEGTPQWSTGDAWVSASYALWLVAVLVTLLVVVPAQEAAATTIEAGQDASAAGRRITLAACAATVCWTAIVVLMVYKPGA